jgi:hypothetical protein
MILYHIRTGCYLPRCKKIFDCRCKAKEHIREILDMRDKRLAKDEIKACIAVTIIDDEKMPDYHRYFKESVLRSPSMEKSSD